MSGVHRLVLLTRQKPLSEIDLAVNSGSERGLLSIALHPDFPSNPSVYLYWTESSTRADTGDLALVSRLGNRVDRFRWERRGLDRAIDHPLDSAAGLLEHQEVVRAQEGHVDRLPAQGGILAGAGHWAQYEAAAQVNERLRAFFLSEPAT